MRITPTGLEGVLLIEPPRFADGRGFFTELFHAGRYAPAGITQAFVQDNFSRSRRGVIRGLHFQQPNSQGKLITCLRGAVFDVALDVRRGSPTFGRWVSAELDEASGRQLWIPPGFAHGFCVISDEADVLYKVTDFWTPVHERTIAWNDPDLAIRWPVENPQLSDKDRAAPRLKDAPVLNPLV
jgi:dTDP-4-dehydrorhamnose 3,5-epimerase